MLASGGHAYTVHAPHALDLMDLETYGLQRGALEFSAQFAARIGTLIVVCTRAGGWPHATLDTASTTSSPPNAQLYGRSARSRESLA